jgi:hypothetical protein
MFVFDVVVVVVVVKDDGYIHSSTAVAGDDWDTTSIFINLLDEFLFFFSFPKV